MARPTTRALSTTTLTPWTGPTGLSVNHLNPDGSVSTLNTLACYDSVGNVLSLTAPRANLSSVSCPGTTSTPFTSVYGYDAAGRLISVTDPDRHQSSVAHDQNGNRITATDANNNTTSYSFDAINRLTQTSQPFIPDHPVVNRVVYDADGNVVPRISQRAIDQYNPVAESLVNDILNDPAAQISARVHGGLGPIIDIYGGQFGYGVRYSTSGRFIGFLNP